MGWQCLAFDNIDGVCSSAVLQRMALLKGQSVSTKFVLYPDFSSSFESLPMNPSNVTFILDLSPSELSNVLRIVNKLRGSKVYWNTHHKVSEETGDMLKSAGITFDNTQGVSATTMITERFLPHDNIAQELSRIATDREFWRRLDDRSEKISDLIASGKDKQKLSESLSRGVFWNPEWEKEVEEYRLKKRSALSTLLARLVLKRLSKWFVGFVLADTFLNSADAGQFVLDQHSTVDIVVIIFRSGRISFRRRDECTVDVSLFAKKFRGGGHPYASGGLLGQQVTLQNFQETVFSVDQTMRKVLSV